MSKVSIPAPPSASWEGLPKTAVRRAPRDLKKIAPLDSAFLQKTYRVNLLVGLMLMAGYGFITQSIGAAVSCLAGTLSGLLVFKAKELLVLRMVRPKDAPPYDGPGKWLPRWAIGPGKFVLVAAAIAALRHFNLMDYVAFVLGCVTVQVVVIAMALFHLLGQRDAGRSLNEIYVQPHLKNKPHA